MLVDLTVFRHRLLLKQTFKSTNTMKRNKGIKAPVQAGIEDFKGIFHDQIRAMVRDDAHFYSALGIPLGWLADRRGLGLCFGPLELLRR